MKAALLVICISSIASAEPVGDFLAAVNKNDATTSAAMVEEWPFKSYGMWFPSKKCAAFNGDATVAKSRWPAYVSCLAELGLTRSPIESDVYIFDPGSAVITMFIDEKLHGLGSFTKEPGVPSVYPPIMAAHLPDGAMNMTSAGETTELTVCVTAKGSVDKATIVKADPKADKAAVLATVKKWTYRPFVRDGKAIRVCGSAFVHAR